MHPDSQTVSTPAPTVLSDVASTPIDAMPQNAPTYPTSEQFAFPTLPPTTTPQPSLNPEPQTLNPSLEPRTLNPSLSPKQLTALNLLTMGKSDAMVSHA